jgi:hypothetical protein
MAFVAIKMGHGQGAMLVVTASPARIALKNSQLTCGEKHAISGTGH